MFDQNKFVMFKDPLNVLITICSALPLRDNFGLSSITLIAEQCPPLVHFFVRNGGLKKPLSKHFYREYFVVTVFTSAVAQNKKKLFAVTCNLNSTVQLMCEVLC